jgi:type I restriction enzyme, S subunit
MGAGRGRRQPEVIFGRFIVAKRVVYATIDRETLERAGAGGTFQVISIQDEEGTDLTHYVDQGRHYNELSEVRADLIAAIKASADDIEIEEQA